MKRLFALSLFLICAGAQAQETTDTVVVNMLNFSTAGSDSSDLEFNRSIQRYFNRNLRGPLRGTESVDGYASVSFIVDKEGKVINPQCPSMTNRSVGQEALRVTKKLSKTRVGPLYRNGAPVAAKVNINICFTSNVNLEAKKEDIHSKAAIIVVSFTHAP